MATQKAMGRVPSLGGKPSTQAMKSALGEASQPLRSKGKPANLKGIPATKATTQAAKKPKGKAPPSFKKGNIKGIKKGVVANVKGGTTGKIKATDMGIG